MKGRTRAGDDSTPPRGPLPGVLSPGNSRPDSPQPSAAAEEDSRQGDHLGESLGLVQPAAGTTPEPHSGQEREGDWGRVRSDRGWEAALGSTQCQELVPKLPPPG